METAICSRISQSLAGASTGVFRQTRLLELVLKLKCKSLSPGVKAHMAGPCPGGCLCLWPGDHTGEQGAGQECPDAPPTAPGCPHVLKCRYTFRQGPLCLRQPRAPLSPYSLGSSLSSLLCILQTMRLPPQEEK